MKTLASASICFALALAGGALIETTVGIGDAVARPNGPKNKPVPGPPGPFQGGNQKSPINPSRGVGQNSGNLSTTSTFRRSTIPFAPGRNR